MFLNSNKHSIVTLLLFKFITSGYGFTIKGYWVEWEKLIPLNTRWFAYTLVMLISGLLFIRLWILISGSYSDFWPIKLSIDYTDLAALWGFTFPTLPGDIGDWTWNPLHEKHVLYRFTMVLSLKELNVSLQLNVLFSFSPCILPLPLVDPSWTMSGFPCVVHNNAQLWSGFTLIFHFLTMFIILCSIEDKNHCWFSASILALTLETCILHL